MICPLLAIATQGDLKEAHRSLVMCAKEECAGWNAKVKKCDPTGLIDVLTEIRDKMPHEG